MGAKVLVTDMDGTLLNSRKEISAATKEAIGDILRRGHKVILASGRPTPGMRPYESELELKKYGGYLMSFNGARIVECDTGEIIYQRTLPSVLLPELYRFAREAECGLATHLENEAISAFVPDRYITMEAHMNGMSVRMVEDFIDFVDFDVYKCLMTAEPARAAVLEKQLQDKFGHAASIYRSDPYFIEVMPKNVDKAASLARMLAVIGMGLEDTVCCGDGYNDLSMIKCAGVGVAMGNAQPEVKAAADYITADNDSDGLAEAIRVLFAED